MSSESAISNHYLHGNLLKAIESGITKAGKSIDTITMEDLGPVDEFHIGGRMATMAFLDQLGFSENDHVLDVGCGLGGAARFAAQTYKNHVSGIDLTKEYIETGKVLNTWVKLDNRICLQHGSADCMPFEDAAFDGGYMLHVGMNIADKRQLFREIHRVLRPGAKFGIYDVMRTTDGELAYPVPWASERSMCQLATAQVYRQALTAAGFEVLHEINRRNFGLDFFAKAKAKARAAGGPPPIGLHTLMQETTAIKLQNMIANISAERIAPIEMIAIKN